MWKTAFKKFELIWSASAGWWGGATDTSGRKTFEWHRMENFDNVTHDKFGHFLYTEFALPVN